jgi:Domain of unknown function (DUF5103)
MKNIYLLFLLFSIGGSAQKKLLREDRTYEDQIRTIQLYPATGAPYAYQQAATASIHQQNLVLAFDDLQEEYNNYYVRLLHCNHDWSPSSLKDMDFLREYNEFVINQYELSNNTNIIYYHYQFTLPRVSLAGNYVAVVYREGDKDDLILTKRFMIYDNRVVLGMDNQISGLGTLRSTNQQINFTVNYKSMEIINPLESVSVVIRQNQRWDHAKFKVPPSFVREDIRQLEYRVFDQEKQFVAGNEFRFVDFRSINFPGQNTTTIDRKAHPWELHVMMDQSREANAYAQYRDLNGRYIIDNRDYQDDPVVAANYLFVNFTLASRPVSGKVYVIGAFNQWQRTPENELTYNASQSAYVGSYLLKQGFYDYQYVLEGQGLLPYQMEGSHFETENEYEILVYYRPFLPAADLLIGYYVLPVNKR